MARRDGHTVFHENGQIQEKLFSLDIHSAVKDCERNISRVNYYVYEIEN